jgi:hypothetical protein
MLTVDFGLLAEMERKLRTAWRRQSHCHASAQRDGRGHREMNLPGRGGWSETRRPLAAMGIVCLLMGPHR